MIKMKVKLWEIKQMIGIQYLDRLKIEWWNLFLFGQYQFQFCLVLFNLIIQHLFIFPITVYIEEKWQTLFEMTRKVIRKNLY